MEKNLGQTPSSCVKVVLFGPESTGKTSLSKQLARYYDSVWVPEFARAYLQEKWNNTKTTCTAEDLLPIAEGQINNENRLVSKANKVLICDTDLLETKVYSEAYYIGSCDPILEKFALKNTYDMYFLTYIDVPWEADDLRDKPTERKEMYDFFENTLIKHNRPYTVLKGSPKERLRQATQIIDNLILKNASIY